ncbi:F1 sector of membrane-bound ATP synthase, delta subunit [Azotobacter vinelandii CA]|uniref:ATP synthase subunit delta n=2 Tax=Azotobacter vinelandii TaxID=354 RepID=ATPD_AZOVD|nr:F0F1 ATP synthase subunit delta [Azotobacter vinelandii]C1DND6.1 RecName: Full=ATP synthase subunit delta; AltName: Full=ATP synthase F(1) sector subunit delta; AltName: Full=F-type ATPase subunit delta; Short=F-ATPase subunit delta [Azotobacter vinelandii DJ]ACO81294.1 F1 sector of membrane-bound ATP synthase, delta subunit [Azotobacter vinelandii DJ]AGK13281.1 F1 sector of membrane-bound ATP synthase, delta subunit [Azotobacter vinelandii CA]AGK17599.1 F1 sector of membrane-bound ATP synth
MINNQTLARPYAKAAFEYASAANGSDAWSGMLGLAAAVVEAPEVAELLRNPRLTRESKVEAVLRLFADDVDEAFRNFIANLGEHDRLFVLPTVREQFEAYKAEAEKTIDVELETAYELSAEQLETLAAALSKRLDRSVNPRQVVNPALIGGLVIRAGDLVVDGSVRGKLSQLAESLKS